MEGIEYYTITIQALQPYVDAFIAETLSSSEEAIQVVQSLSNHVSIRRNHFPPTSNSTDANVATSDLLFVSFTVNTDGYLRGNENIIVAISSVLDYYTSNCSNLKRK